MVAPAPARIEPSDDVVKYTGGIATRYQGRGCEHSSLQVAVRIGDVDLGVIVSDDEEGRGDIDRRGVFSQGAFQVTLMGYDISAEGLPW